MIILLFAGASYAGLTQNAESQSTVKEPASANLMLREPARVDGYFTLPLGEQSVPATFLPQTLGKNYGNVLILSDRSDDIDSAVIVHSLRTQLPRSGWATMTVALDYPAQTGLFLSAKTTTKTESNAEQNKADASEQTPLLPDEDKQIPASDSPPTHALSDKDDFVSNAARVAGAVAYLHARNPGELVIIVIGESVNLITPAIENLAADYGIVWINAPTEIYDIAEDVPVLDIIPGNNETLTEIAIQRRAKLVQAQANAHYSQRIIHGADKFFTGFEAPLFSVLRGWLYKQFVSNEQQ